MLTESSLYTGKGKMHEGPGLSSPVFIFSGCFCAAQGLRSLLTASGQRIIHVRTDGGGAFEPRGFLQHVTPGSRVVMYLPGEPQNMLATLQAFSLFIRLSRHSLPTLILSSCRPDWLYRTLGYQMGDLKTMSVLRALPVSTSLPDRSLLLRTEGTPLLLVRQAREMERRSVSRVPGMTKRELETVLWLLRGESIAEISRHTGTSTKTLYSQRHSGLKKLQVACPALNIRHRHTW